MAHVAPVYETRFASSGATVSVHSATAAEISRGRIRAFWYGGSREGAKDVRIYSSVFDPDTLEWSPEAAVVTREQTEQDTMRSIRKLGNPVVSRDGDGRLWLFYVSVSVGGWSGSAVNVRVSEDEGRSWSRSKRLVTSPFLNLSTLVRGPAIRFRDGSQGLPVYHELFGKFGELLRVDARGRVLDKRRLTWGRSSLQPVIVPMSGEDAIGLLRSSGASPRRILSVLTSDAGRHWTRMKATPLSNPDAGIAAIRSRAGELFVAFNDSETDRGNLTIAVSENGGDTWEIVHVLHPPEPPGDEKPRFAYPWFLQTDNGMFHLFYTWNRRRIAHVRFNREWIRRQQF